MSIVGVFPRLRWNSAATALLAVIFVGLLDGGPPAAAGREHRAVGLQSQAHQRVVRLVELSPRFGPPGTSVTLTVRLMPAMTPVQLSIGGTQSGFEALALAQTSPDGDLEETVELPAWTKRDRPHRFIVFNLYFSTVLAESGIFHVTDADGTIVREGAVGSSGGDCPTLEGDDGERYRLIGATQGREIGDRVVVEGAISESDEGCGEGLSLDLTIISLQ